MTDNNAENAMRILIIYGSPRKSGNTASLLKPFMEEAEALGAQVEFMDVYEKKIAGCRACLGCQKDRTTISCVIDDDMQPVLKALGRADLIVIAAPVYAWSAPAPVKAVIDRMIYASCKYYGGDAHGPALLIGKRLALITTYGYPAERASDLYEEAMKRFCKHCRLTYAGLLGERQRNLAEPFMDEAKEEHARRFARKLIGAEPVAE